MIQAPFTLHKFIVKKISKEIKIAKNGGRGRIIARMNSLVDPSVVNALYSASKAGVQIDLIVRGICCLRPGLEGVSENINVYSIIGRFLEHNRVYYFENHTDNNSTAQKVFISSADWMPRNLRNRIELCTPITDETIKSTIINDLHLYLKDNSNSWFMQSDGHYAQSFNHDGEEKPISAQNNLLTLLAETAETL